MQFVDAFMISEDCHLCLNSNSIILLKYTSVLFNSGLSGLSDSVGFLFCIVCIACKLVWCYASAHRISDSNNLLHGQLSSFRHGKSFVVRLFISLAFLLQLNYMTFRAAYKHTQSHPDHSHA